MNTIVVTMMRSLLIKKQYSEESRVEPIDQEPIGIRNRKTDIIIDRSSCA
jgi:hypothetical protein